MKRLDRDSMFMNIAQTVALRGTCPRAQVGAVLVQQYRPISIGYNGAPPGMPHCLDVGCEYHHRCPTCGKTWTGLNEDEVCSCKAPELTAFSHAYAGCQRTIHAEANAIAWAARAGLSTEGAIMYATYSPCRKCAELMASARIIRLIYLNDYRAADLALLERMGIGVIKYDPTDTRLCRR